MLSQYTLMILDDDPVNRMLIATLAKKQGFDVVEVVSGEQCIEQFKTQNISALITDCEMPNMEGPEVCREIRRLEQSRELSHQVTPIPIVALSGLSLQEMHARFSDSNVNHFFKKPVKHIELIDTLARHFIHHESH